jgi:hypothetical protein
MPCGFARYAHHASLAALSLDDPVQCADLYPARDLAWCVRALRPAAVAEAMTRIHMPGVETAAAKVAALLDRRVASEWRRSTLAACANSRVHSPAAGAREQTRDCRPLARPVICRRDGERFFEGAIARELLAGYVEKLAQWAVEGDGSGDGEEGMEEGHSRARLEATLCCLGEHLPE